MPNVELLIAFAAAAAVFAYMPGPAMLYATARTLAGGRAAGWRAAAGIHLGGYVHVFAAALGLAALFLAMPTMYLLLKLAGAAYLVWLGIGLWLNRGKASPGPHAPARPTRGAFWQSVTVEALNPKTALFFVAFLPQFTDPAATWPIWIQLMVLGVAANLIFSSADVGCVLLADRLSAGLRRSARAAAWVRRAGGGILIALGCNLALNRA